MIKYYIYKSYRRKNRNKCHQYRLNGRIVSEETYYDTRSELIQKGANVLSCNTVDLNDKTELTMITMELKERKNA